MKRRPLIEKTMILSCSPAANIGSDKSDGNVHANEESLFLFEEVK